MQSTHAWLQKEPQIETTCTGSVHKDMEGVGMFTHTFLVGVNAQGSYQWNALKWLTPVHGVTRYTIPSQGTCTNNESCVD